MKIQPNNITRMDVDLYAPEHGRTSCNDTHLHNSYVNESGYPRCNRCFLLEMVNCAIYDEVEIELSLSILVPSKVKPKCSYCENHHERN